MKNHLFLLPLSAALICACDSTASPDPLLLPSPVTAIVGVTQGTISSVGVSLPGYTLPATVETQPLAGETDVRHFALDLPRPGLSSLLRGPAYFAAASCAVDFEDSPWRTAKLLFVSQLSGTQANTTLPLNGYALTASEKGETKVGGTVVYVFTDRNASLRGTLSCDSALLGWKGIKNVQAAAALQAGWNRLVLRSENAEMILENAPQSAGQSGNVSYPLDSWAMSQGGV